LGEFESYRTGIAKAWKIMEIFQFEHESSQRMQKERVGENQRKAP